MKKHNDSISGILVRFVTVFLLLLTLFPAGAAAQERASTERSGAGRLAMENSHVRLNFTLIDDMRLNSVEGLPYGSQFDMKDRSIWRISIREPSSGTQTIIDPSVNSSNFTYSYVDHGTYLELIANWADIQIDATNKIDLVKVTATLADDDLVAEMKIDVTTTLPDYSLYKVFFPELYFMEIDGDGRDDRLTYPQHGGYILSNPTNKMNPIGWPHPGYWAMQFFSLFDPSGLLYFGTDDAEGYIKVFSMVSDVADDHLYWRLENYPENHVEPDTDYSMPYNFELGAMQGDWFDAATYYREWALGNIVTRKPMYDPNTDFPQSLLDIDGLTAYALGNSAGGLTLDLLIGMKQSKNFYGIDNVACTLYLWTNEPGTSAPWPDVTPVYNIADGVALMHNDGDLAIPYVQMAYDIYLPSYVTKNIEYYAIKNIDGSIYVLNDLARPDPTMEFWRDFSSDWNVLVTDSLGFDGSYWDYWSGLNLADYDVNHGHPLGGGKYHINGKIQQAEETIAAVEQLPGVDDWILSSEYVNEFFVDINEIEMWNEDQWDVNVGDVPMVRLPMYEVVYGDRQMIWTVAQTYLLYQPLWTRYAAYKHAAKMSIGLTLGFNGTLADPYEPVATPYGQAAFYFLGRLLRAYDYAREFLMWGQLLHPLDVQDVASMPYGDIMTQDPSTTLNHWIYTSSFPEVSLVLPSVWGTIDTDGRYKIGILLINWFEETRSITYTVRFDDYGLNKGVPYVLKSRDETAERSLSIHRKDFKRTDFVDPYSLKFFVLEPLYTPKVPDGRALSVPK